MQSKICITYGNVDSQIELLLSFSRTYGVLRTQVFYLTQPQMLSNEIPRFAQLDKMVQTSKRPLHTHTSPTLPFPQPACRQLDNVNYSDDGGLSDRRCGSSACPRPPRQCAELTSLSSSQKRSGADCGGAHTLVWGGSIICRNSPPVLACLPGRHAYCTSQPVCPNIISCTPTRVCI